MRRKKGFTLIEMIIVLAIIGILLAVLIPSWGFYIQHSRTKAQNNKAKAIFDAAQTVVTDMNFAERKAIAAYEKPGATAADKTKALNSIYSHVPGKANEFYYYWDGVKGYRVEADGTNFATNHPGYTNAEYTAANKSEWDEKIGDSIKRIVDENMVYKIYVKDYIVQSVASARFERDSYIGAYPTNLDQIDDWNKVDVDSIRNSDKVLGADMKLFDLNTDDVK